MKRDVDAHDLSLSQNLALKAQLGLTSLKIFPKGITYDYSCPVVQDLINRLLRSACGLYLASIKKMSSHNQVHINPQTKENDPHHH